MMDRRQFTKLALLGGSLLPWLSACQSKGRALAQTPVAPQPPLSPAAADAVSQKAHLAFMGVKDDGFKMLGDEQIAMLMYPGFTALDLVGPHYLFSSMMGAKVYLVSSGDDLAPIKCGEGLTFVPTHSAQDCPEALDVFFVPGGANGTLEAMKNPKIISLIAQKAATAKYITSVCTGSLLLGQAGLLKGKKATSHWVTIDLLAEFGAIPLSQRVVWDGNLVTGGGVTAGIDFGLEIVAALRGEMYAKALQLQGEYDPAPPFDAGSPSKAGEFLSTNLRGMFTPLVENFRRAIIQAKT